MSRAGKKLKGYFTYPTNPNPTDERLNDLPLSFKCSQGTCELFVCPNGNN